MQKLSKNGFLNLEYTLVILSTSRRQRRTNALRRSAATSLSFAYGINRFSHDMTSVSINYPRAHDIIIQLLFLTALNNNKINQFYQNNIHILSIHRIRICD